MVLADKQVYRNIIGGLLHNPILLSQYPDINPTADFEEKYIQNIFMVISNMIHQGCERLTPLDVDYEMKNHETAYVVYKANGGLDFLNDSYSLENAGENFEYFYEKLKKLSLLRRLRKEKFDISYFFKETCDSQKEEEKLLDRLEECTIENILEYYDGHFNIVRADYLTGPRHNGKAAAGLKELVLNFKKVPDIGPAVCGEIFNATMRGARPGIFFLRSASSGTGKSRIAVYDSAKIAFPEHYSLELGTFVCEKEGDDIREPRKTLFITTEMAKDEIQTIVLSYLSGVNEHHIITGQYDLGEEERIMHAIGIIEKYEDSYYIEQIANPNIENVTALIKKYAVVNEIKYCFYDYIFTSPSLIEQFNGTRVREDVALAMLSNALKELATEYNLFIASSTQVNAKAMEDFDGFRDESCIRGSRAVADKIDIGTVMARVSEKDLNRLRPLLQTARILDIPTHVFDIYKMRRGQYKNVRVWSSIDLSNGRRKDLFMTDMSSNNIIQNLTLIQYNEMEQPYDWRNQG